MPPGTIIQLLVGIVALAIMFFTWLNKKNDAKEKVIEDEDKKIDSANSFDDFVRINDELHNK